MLDVSIVVGHGAVLAVLLFTYSIYRQGEQIIVFFVSIG